MTPPPTSEPIYDYPPQPCPYCGYRTDAATRIGGVRDDAPTDGDVSLCLACGRPAIFCLGGRGIREPTQAEADEIWQDPDVVKAWQTIQQMRVARRDWPKGGPR